MSSDITYPFRHRARRTARIGSGSAWPRVRAAVPGRGAWVLAAWVLAASVLPARAQNDAQVTFTVSPQTLTLGEPAVAEFSIHGVRNAPSPSLPEVPDLRVDSQPSRSYNTSIINGSVSQTVTYRYRMTPLREGTFTIGPFDYTLDRQTITIPARRIEVAPRPVSGTGGGLENNLMARIEPDRARVYMQEAVPVTLSIYYRGITIGSNLGLDGLPSSGLEFEAWREVQSEPEIIDSVVYQVRRFRTVMRPLTAGTFVVKPDLRVPVRVTRGRSRTRSPFDLFSAMTADTENVTVFPEPVAIEVLPLPEENRPVTFSGAVGQFTFHVTSKPDRVQVGDPITLTMSITGRGNMDAVSAPELAFGPAFKIYEPKLTATKLTDDRTSGSKTFEQVIIPRQEDTDALPPIQFSFFAPRDSTYHTLDQGPFPVEILPRSNAVARVIQAAPSDETAPELQMLEQDIVYLQPPPDTWIRLDRRPWYRHPVFLAAQVLPPLFALVLFAATRRRHNLTVDVARARRLRAPRKARSGIERAYEAINQSDNHHFYEAVWDAMCAYFGDRLNLAPGEVSADTVAAAFSKAGMKKEDLEQMAVLFDLCVQIRFGQGWSEKKGMDEADARNAAIILEKLERVIRECERVRW